MLYKEVYAKPNQPIMEQVQTLLEADITDDSDTLGVSRAWTTELERLTILKLLYLNRKRLSAEYHPTDKKIESKYGLKASFALPLGPLSLRDIGRLTTNLGCEVCGSTNISRCVQCRSVAYCGKSKCSIFFLVKSLKRFQHVKNMTGQTTRPCAIPSKEELGV